MKRWLRWAVGTGLLAGALALGDQPPAASEDPILKAMREEAARSLQLTVANLERPYFVQYVLDQSDVFTISASLGGLLARSHQQVRAPEMEVRVGDYKFDNTNFAGGGYGGRYDLGPWPVENAYPLLRRYLWLATDEVYKSAVETIARKRAALRDLTQTDPLDDFAHAPVVHYTRDLNRLAIDEDAWSNRVRTLSAVFAQYPEVKDSRVDLESNAGGYYVVNSEGTQVRAQEDVTFVRIRAMAQAPDGSPVRDLITYHATDPAHMPGDVELTRGAKELAERVIALAHAAQGEDYNGPVLFEGEAAAQVFAEVLGRNFALPRKPAGGRGVGFTPSEFEGRQGSRVLPDSFDVVDDPTQREWRGRALFGSYDVDREGMMAQPVTLVEKGVLKGFLLTRQPVKGFSASNGHARLPGAYGASSADIGNLFVRSSEGVPVAELKKKLIEMIQARGKPYGILVRKMDFPSSAPIDEVRRMFAEASGSAQPISSPVLVYKVFPDGREELIRNVRLRGFSAHSLKDIELAGDDATVFDFLDSTAPMALIGASSFTTEACVVAPSFLIDDVELRKIEEEQPKLPVVPAPELTR